MEDPSFLHTGQSICFTRWHIDGSEVVNIDQFKVGGFSEFKIMKIEVQTKVGSARLPEESE
jgi:hypothetical protein